jgi:hypothetical protein
MLENLLGLRLIDTNNGNTGTITEVDGNCCEDNHSPDDFWVIITHDDGESSTTGCLYTLLSHWRFIN